MRTGGGSAGAARAGGCAITIEVKCAGDVHIHNRCGCCDPDGGGPPPPAGSGACVPTFAGHKHHQSREQRLDARAQGTRVASSLAAATLHTTRRYLDGKAAANPMETACFGILDRMTPQARDTVACALDAYEALPPGHRSTVFEPSLALDPDQPVGQDVLATAWAQEVIERAGELVFADPQAPAQERAGRIRVYEPQGEDFFSQVRICRVNGLRTASYIPALGPGDYLPSELFHDCEVIDVGGQPQVSCQVRTADCPGQTLSGACAAVPEVTAGDGVVLEGVNYFSTDAVVRLTNRTTGTSREVAAHVWGDLDTPVRETVGGEQRLVNDCRVHDRLTFQVPDDLAAGPYEIRVVVPNVTGIAKLGQRVESNSEFIAVVPPPTARFEIASETLHARAETSPSWAGSDEVGFTAVAVGLRPDLSTDVPPISTRVRFGDVDTGETRPMARVLFSHQQPIVGVAMSILGHEIDSEDAYEKLTDDVVGIFVDLVKEQLVWAKGALAAAGGASLLGKLGPVGWIAIGIAVGVTLAIDAVVALWAPADLIMEDVIGPTTLALTQLTGGDFPAPAPSTHATEGGLSVNVTPLDKAPTQYRESREYVSDDEDSRYELTLRFNRVA